MPADALTTFLACTSVATLGGLAVVVLPWRAEELTESWLAWRLLAARVRSVGQRLREVPAVEASPTVRTLG